VLDMILLGVYLIVVPIMSAAAVYALGWFTLALVRFIPLIGRKHRHADWDRLNR
jgi:hypothetical protein